MSRKPAPVASVNISQPNRFFQILIFAGLCLIIPFILYGPALRAPFVFDDFSNIVDNQDLRRPDRIGPRLFNTHLLIKNRQTATRPVTSLSFALNYGWYHLNPEGYRLFNIAVHAVNTLLVFCMTVLIFRRLRDPDLTAPLAFAAALVFCVHPLQTEVVAYISHRSDSLATCFYLSSMLAFFAAYNRHWLCSVPAAILFVLAMGSKEWTYATLPVALLIMDYLIFSRPEKPRIWRHVPFWALAVTVVVGRRVLTGRWGFLGPSLDLVWTPLSYLGVQTYVWLKYISLAFLPLWQTFDHYLVPGAPGLGLKVFLSAGFWMALALGAGYACHKAGWEKISAAVRNAASDPKVRMAWLGLALAVILIAPTSGFFPAYEAMAERRVYLALWGAALAWIVLLGRLIGFGGALMAALAVHIVLLAALTWRRCHLYQHPERLWQEATARYPENAGAHLNLGVAEMKKGHPDKALHSWLHAIELQNLHNPEAYNNVGEYYFQRGEFQKALEYFKEAARQDPDLHIAWRNMGDANYELKKDAAAGECYDRAISISPDEAELHNNRGLIFERQKKLAEAERAYLTSIELDPDFTDAHANLAELYVQTERLPEALKQFEIWGTLDPSNAEIPRKIDALRRWMSQKTRPPK